MMMSSSSSSALSASSAAASALSTRARVAHVLIASLFATMGFITLGYCMGYSSPIHAELVSTFNITAADYSLFGGLVNVGALGGVLVGGPLSNGIGRRWSLAIATLPAIGGYLLISFADGVLMLLIGRALTGVSGGMFSLIVPVYIADISDKERRGIYGTINQILGTVGVLAAYALGAILDFRWLARIAAAPGVVLLVGAIFFMPESPAWLVGKRRVDQARTVLSKLRGAQYPVEAELEEMLASVLGSTRGAGAAAEETVVQKAGVVVVVPIAASSRSTDRCADRARRTCTRRFGVALLVSVVLMLMQQFCGINAVVFFSDAIFEQAGIHDVTLYSIIVVCAQTLSVFLTVFVIDRAGRRVLLLVSSIAVAVSNVLMGVSFILIQQFEMDVGWLSLASLVAFRAMFAVALGGVPWLIMSEIFPLKGRALGSTISASINWTSSFIVTSMFSSMAAAFGSAGIFFFYAAVCVAGAVFVVVAMPETKGKSAEEVGALLDSTLRCSGGRCGGAAPATRRVGDVELTSAGGVVSASPVRSVDDARDHLALLRRDDDEFDDGLGTASGGRGGLSVSAPWGAADDDDADGDDARTRY